MSRKSFVTYGWLVLFACAAIELFYSATFMNGFTVFFNPLVDDFGWSYTLVSLATTFRGFEIGIFSPIVGFFVDKFGARKLLIACAVMGALGFFLFSRMNSVLTYFVAFVVLGVSISLSSPVVVLPVVIKWFRKRPSLAMGFLLSGSALAGLLVPAIVWSVDTSGWRDTLFYFAVGSAILCIPLACLVKDPPDTSPKPTGQKVPETPVSGREVVKSVIKKKNFWLLSLSTAFVGFASAAIATHQMPYLASVGISRETAGWMVVVFSISSLVGRLTVGWLGDIIDKRLCFNISALLQTAGLAVYAYSDSVAGVFPSMVAFGIGVGGSMTIRNALQLDFFGLRGYAVVQGLLVVFVTIGFMAAPPIAGWIFDSTHSYRPAWLAFSALSLIAIPLIQATTKPNAQNKVAAVE